MVVWGSRNVNYPYPSPGATVFSTLWIQQVWSAFANYVRSCLEQRHGTPPVVHPSLGHENTTPSLKRILPMAVNHPFSGAKMSCSFWGMACLLMLFFGIFMVRWGKNTHLGPRGCFFTHESSNTSWLAIMISDRPASKIPENRPVF